MTGELSDQLAAGESLSSTDSTAAVADASAPDLNRDPLLIYENELHPPKTPIHPLASGGHLRLTGAFLAAIIVLSNIIGWTGWVPGHVISQLQRSSIHLLLVAPALLPFLWRRWQARKFRNAENASDAPPPKCPYPVHWHDRDEFRLGVNGMRKDLEREFATPLSDEFFEQRVYRLWGEMPREGRVQRAVVWVVLCGFALCAFDAMRRVSNMGTVWQAEAIYDWFAAVSISWLPLMVFWPSYLRISPGKLEFLRYDTWGRTIVESHVFDLRQARMRMEGQGNAIYIQPPNDKLYRVDMPVLCNGLQLARYMFEAARWRGEHSTTPADSLST